MHPLQKRCFSAKASQEAITVFQSPLRSEVKLSRRQVKSGKVRIVAVTSAARSTLLPDIPTIAESDDRLRDFDVIGWVGLGGRAGLPDQIVRTLNSQVAEVLFDPAISERLRAIGNEPTPSTPSALKARLASDITKWASVIAAAGIERI